MVGFTPHPAVLGGGSSRHLQTPQFESGGPQGSRSVPLKSLVTGIKGGGAGVVDRPAPCGITLEPEAKCAAHEPSSCGA